MYLTEIWPLLLALMICLLYGSIPFALIFTYVVSGKYLDREGTGNIGIANAFGLGGFLAGFLSVAASASQAALPFMLNFYWLHNGPETNLILLLAVIIGAQFVLLFRSKPMNAGTILLWGLLFCSPYSLLLFGIVFGAIFLTSRNTRITTILGYALLPAELWLVERAWPFVIFGLLAAMLYAFRYDPKQSEYQFYRDKKWISWQHNNTYIQKLRSAKRLEDYGRKAYNLRRLERLGAHIPSGWVCSTKAYQNWLADDREVLNKLEREIKTILKPGNAYAVRSSSVLEDGKSHSFAGQFDSYLDLSSADQILIAIKNIWQSTSSDRVKSYQEKTRLNDKTMGMAIIIQEMVASRLAGVVFTSNPLNGLSETIVEAIIGNSEDLLQKGFTPMRWVFKWGELLESPPQGKEFTALSQQVACIAKSYAQKYGKPLDLEWAWDGKEIFWLQMRTITAIHGINIYSNRISKEFMPGIIKPLVWSINTTVVNTAWKQLFRELIGKQAESIEIHKLTKAFYYRSYFNMGIIGDIFELLGMPRESLELLLGIEVIGAQRPRLKPGLKTLRFMPAMLAFAISKVFYRKRLEHYLQGLSNIYRDLSGRNLETTDAPDMLTLIDELIQLNTKGSYHVIMSRILAGIFDILVKKIVPGYEIESQVDNRLSLMLHSIDPAWQFDLLRQSLRQLNPEMALRIPETYRTDSWQQPVYRSFRHAFEDFIGKFGHLSDSGNDFSQEQWQENPRLILGMLATESSMPRIKYLHKETLTEIQNIKLNPFQKYIIARAAEARYLRIRSNSTYEYGYSLFRKYCLALGTKLVNRDILEKPEDIFYIYHHELKKSLAHSFGDHYYKVLVDSRKTDVENYAKATLPAMIIGDDLPLPIANHTGDTCFKGVAVSRGYYEGLARIVRSVKDFTNVTLGDVLIIPYSDVSWTPLLSRAGAIISESGGMLSHCAIVAREYGIPAVVSVNNAMTLRDGQKVAVNGSSGEVTLLDN
jgi:phosphohistidine swiveling domain-containing protein/glycerol-3-phosphate acyltransferase PlsY